MFSFLKNKYLLMSIFFILGIVLGYFLTNLIRPNLSKPDISFKQLRLPGYELINPLIDCDNFSSINNQELFLFKNDMVKLIDKDKNANLKDVSVYFRDLNNGAWFGVDENADFSPASLLKVPVMMAYLKKADDNEAFLNTKLKYAHTFTEELSQNIKPTKSIELGKEYSIDELLKYMIVYSDNNAKNVLLEGIDSLDLNQIYTDLGVNIPGTTGMEDYMSVKDYAAFFRILYNASYLDKDMSQKALELLSQSDFLQGLTSGIPKDVKIAQKFGERKMDDITQLHDCGIVYYPKKPYLLCVMTRGNDFNYQAKVIGQISKTVYDSVDKQINK